MADWPSGADQTKITISPGSILSNGPEFNAMKLTLATAAWPGANVAIYVPFALDMSFTARLIFVENGLTISGNVDVGIYDLFGNRMVSSGSTAQAGASSIQQYDIGDTVLPRGAYYMAMAMDNTTGMVGRWAPAVPLPSALGVLNQSSAFPLPATATFASPSQAYIPGIFLTDREVV